MQLAKMEDCSYCLLLGGFVPTLSQQVPLQLPKLGEGVTVGQLPTDLHVEVSGIDASRLTPHAKPIDQNDVTDRHGAVRKHHVVHVLDTLLDAVLRHLVVRTASDGLVQLCIVHLRCSLCAPNV